MAGGRIRKLRFTDHAIGAPADWGILPDDLYDIVRRGDYVVARNRRGRAASHMLIGYDARGRCVAAPIAPTPDPAIWRIITVWPCKGSEASKFQ